MMAQMGGMKIEPTIEEKLIMAFKKRLPEFPENDLSSLTIGVYKSAISKTQRGQLRFDTRKLIQISLREYTESVETMS